MWLLGAHGGAAVSTLTASLAWAGDSGRAIPNGRTGINKGLIGNGRRHARAGLNRHFGAQAQIFFHRLRRDGDTLFPVCHFFQNRETKGHAISAKSGR